MKRIIRVEDDVREKRISDIFFARGLKADDTQCESYEDWEQIDKDMESGNLGHVYILDNEIASETRQGGSMAQGIHDKAKRLQNEGKLDHPVLVITLLCSAPESVRRIYGLELKNRFIPILHKTSEVFLCGFYIGAALAKYKTQPDEEILPFDRWLQESGLSFLREDKNYLAAVSINGKAMNLTQEGSCYAPLPDFIRTNMDNISDRLRAEGNSHFIPLLESVVNPAARGGIENKL